MPAELGIKYWVDSHTSEVQKLMCKVSSMLNPNEYIGKRDISQPLCAGTSLYFDKFYAIA